MGTTLDNFHPGFVYGITQALAQCPGASIGSGYRTIDEQRALLYKRAQGVLVADPGTSRHEGNSGGAVDISGDIDCFANAAAAYGITNTEVPGEPWHFQLSAEALAQIEDGTYQWGEEEGMAAVEPPAESSLAGLRDKFFGGTGGDIDESNRGAFAPEPVARRAAAQTPGATQEGFTPEASAGYTAGDTQMSAVDVAKVYAQAGFTGDALVNMVAISRGESGWDPGANGDTSLTDGTWGPSVGLSQIRSLNDQSGTGGWRDGTRLADPLFNARAAYAISNGGTNFTPWTVWNEGIYQQYVEEAKAAVTALGTGAYAPAQAPPAASMEPNADEMGIGDGELTFDDPATIAREISEMMLTETRMKDKGSVLDEAGLSGTSVDKKETV